MKTLNVEIGSDEWLAARASNGRTSSGARIIMGYDKKSRSEFLRMTATGDEEEFSRWTLEVLFPEGHKVEAMAFPMAERILDTDLAAVTGTTDDGYLLASFDGIDMGETVVWECKQWNEEKAAEVRNGHIPMVDYWQCVHHLIVSGAEKLLYSVTDGTEEKHVYCYLSAEDAADDMRTLLDNWKQWDIDLAAYVPQEVKPVLMGRKQESLPSLLVTVTGMVTSSNLASFKEIAMARIESINLDLRTDQDFADAKEDLDWFEKAETSLETCKKEALKQTQSIEELFSTMDSLKVECRTRRLALEKLVEARKKSLRGEIFNEAVAALAAYIEEVNAGLPAYVRLATKEVAVDFAAAMKGKRNFDSMRDAVAQLLVNVKVSTGQLVAQIHENLNTTAELRAGLDHLFPDLSDLVRQTPAACKAMVENRVEKHNTELRRKEEEQRERIRKEEEAKAQQQAEALAESERQRVRQEEEQKARQQAEAERIAREEERAKLAAEVGVPDLVPPAAEKPETQQEPAAPVRRPAPASTAAAPATPFVPTHGDIVRLLASHYSVGTDVAAGWLDNLIKQQRAA